VVLLDLHAPEAVAAAIPQAVADARNRYPSAPVIVRVPKITAGTVLLAQRAARLRIRAVVSMDEPLYSVLRPVLTRPDDLGDDVAEWMALRGKPLPPRVFDLVRHLVGEAHRFGQLTALLEPLGQCERTARQRFRGNGLPPPSSWHQMGRALHCALRIQAEPQARLDRLALDLGYNDRSGLDHQFTRTFRVTPVAVRGTLGWEWLLDRWFLRPARSDRNGNNPPV
jgi:AraC-like DNA-binding protein